jgi:hypothetical protein
MSVLNPRNRLVNFRLSDEEFERLKNACAQFGARSISDFARGSVLDRIVDGPASASRPGERIVELDHKVSALEGQVSQLLNLIEATGGVSAMAGLQRTAEVGAVHP